MKVAVVVQRYGAEINGGAELHARYLAEHLARHVQVEVLTTCARDYITWANEFAPGASREGSLEVRRFPVTRTRDPQDFGAWSRRVFDTRHSVNDELAWLDAEGPTSPELVRFIAAHHADYDYVLFFSFRYYHAFHGARAIPDKAILVPTAERDEALGLSIFAPVLRGVRACMYNSPEERVLLQAVAGTDRVPGVVVGIGSEVPAHASAERFRQRTGISERTAIYIGRIDENKGCAELFDYWKRYSEITPGGLTLVLIGYPVLQVPVHPRIRHIGFVSDQEKYDALAAAEFLIMPSYFESLSMVALEAWGMGKPVLANGKCDVLRGQAARSNAGLYYDNYAEFVEAVRVIEGSSGVAAALGRNGSRFFRTNYAWPVIERKYLDMFEQLSREPASERADRQMPPLPGWWARRQRTIPAATEVLSGLPSGPIRERAQPLRSDTAPMSRPEARPDSRLAPRPDARPDRRPDQRVQTRPHARAVEGGVRPDARAQRRPDDRRPQRDAREARQTRPPSPVTEGSGAAGTGGAGASPGASRGRARRGRHHGRPRKDGA